MNQNTDFNDAEEDPGARGTQVLLPDQVNDIPFRVSDLKQWAYCARVVYYALCLPDIRPTTYKMEAGAQADTREVQREQERGLQRYGLKDESGARREFGVPLASARWGLRGRADMVIWLGGDPPKAAIPVDYKLSDEVNENVKMQLAAYGLLLEAQYGVSVKRGFIYCIPKRRAQEIKFTPALRQKVENELQAMQSMLWREQMPSPPKERGKCVSCEFRRFCNDV